MARFVAGAVFGLVVGVVAGAAANLRAEDADGITTNTINAANEAGVSLTDLLGAMGSTGLPARAYLLMTGELAPTNTPSQAGAAPGSLSSVASVSSVWDRLAGCESTRRWNANTGNGFYGGIQFDYGTWLRHGGGAFAPRADLATREQQILIGIRTQAAQGWGAWPACSRQLGLR